eukprot:2667378-Rhodomonas_salina.1
MWLYVPTRSWTALSYNGPGTDHLALPTSTTTGLVLIVGPGTLVSLPGAAHAGAAVQKRPLFAAEGSTEGSYAQGTMPYGQLWYRSEPDFVLQNSRNLRAKSIAIPHSHYQITPEVRRELFSVQVSFSSAICYALATRCPVLTQPCGAAGGGAGSATSRGGQVSRLCAYAYLHTHTSVVLASASQPHPSPPPSFSAPRPPIPFRFSRFLSTMGREDVSIGRRVLTWGVQHQARKYHTEAGWDAGVLARRAAGGASLRERKSGDEGGVGRERHEVVNAERRWREGGREGVNGAGLGREINGNATVGLNWHCATQTPCCRNATDGWKRNSATQTQGYGGERSGALSRVQRQMKKKAPDDLCVARKDPGRERGRKNVQIRADGQSLRTCG